VSNDFRHTEEKHVVAAGAVDGCGGIEALTMLVRVYRHTVLYLGSMKCLAMSVCGRGFGTGTVT